MEDEKPVLEQMTDMIAEAAHVTKEAAKKAVKKVKKVAKKVMPKKSAKKKGREKDYEEKEEVETLDRLVILQLCSLHGMLGHMLWNAKIKPEGCLHSTRERTPLISFIRLDKRYDKPVAIPPASVFRIEDSTTCNAPTHSGQSRRSDRALIASGLPDEQGPCKPHWRWRMPEINREINNALTTCSKSYLTIESCLLSLCK